jgi:flagellar motor component MotA
MTYEEFTEAYFKFFDLALNLLHKAKCEGLLSLEDNIDHLKAAERDIFMFGLRLVVDGTDSTIVEKLLSNIIKHEKDAYESLLMTIKKEAVLAIQERNNSRLTAYLLNSYVDIPLNNPRFEKSLADEKLF